uniref:Uncharacterized protein n=1 Tax=Anguilla anguilla TaxID=7936 RepID=A0A0E9WQB2_ANGAN
MNFKLSEEAMNKTNKRTTTNDSKLNKTLLFQCKNCTWPHADWSVLWCLRSSPGSCSFK